MVVVDVEQRPQSRDLALGGSTSASGTDLSQAHYRIPCVVEAATFLQKKREQLLESQQGSKGMISYKDHVSLTLEEAHRAWVAAGSDAAAADFVVDDQVDDQGIQGGRSYHFDFTEARRPPHPSSPQGQAAACIAL